MLVLLVEGRETRKPYWCLLHNFQENMSVSFAYLYLAMPYKRDSNERGQSPSVLNNKPLISN